MAPESTSATQSKPDSEPKSESERENDQAAKDAEAERGFKIFGVRFAPLTTPLRRRLQTLAVAHALLTITFVPILCCLLTAFLLITPFAPLMLLYLGWMLLYDWNTPQRGGRRREWVRRSRIWGWYRDYFPVKLVKSAELPTDANYLIGYHPHGIISCGAFSNFATEATGFSKKFPGITPHLLTLKSNFYIPFVREYYMANGIVDVSRQSIQWLLGGSQGNGNAAIVVVGGAQEALDARPGSCKLTLLKRKGFIRMALRTGAQLVPCYSFGENELFLQANNPPGSKIRAFQQLFKGLFGSSPPLFYGRGMFNYNFGAMPFRRPITTVVGSPISVTREEQPSQELVDQLHETYIEKLKELFDDNKEEFGLPADAELTIV